MSSNLLTNGSTSVTTPVLTQSLDLAQTYLDQFISSSDFNNVIHDAFGDNTDPAVARLIIEQWRAGELPAIEVLSSTDLQGALGAFAVETNTIYVSDEFLQQNAENPDAVAAVLIEELGHALDLYLNETDAIGDEGELFSTFVQGRSLDALQLQTLKTEDDSALLTTNGQTLQVEQATFRNAAFDLIGLTRLRNDSRFRGIDGSGVAVAVIDTGLFGAHPLLDNNYVAGVDFVDGDLIPNDPNGHGTHVAGTIGAEDPNIGVAPDVNLIGLRVLGGSNSNRVISNALQWVLDNHQTYNIVAVNMSLGIPELFLTSEDQAPADDRRAYSTIIQRLENAGVTVVTSAGNDYAAEQRQGISSPAIFSTINVGAVWKDGRRSDWDASDIITGPDRITSYSQRLVAPNTLFAPGSEILSTVIPKDDPFGLAEKGGTSMAAPHIAGAVALLQEAAFRFAGRYLLTTEVTEILTSTADVIFDGDDEVDNVINTGAFYRRLNIYNAVSEVFDRFQGGGVTRDPNGTIQGAYLGPRLTGASSSSVNGTIGVDGGVTPVGNTDVDIIRFEVVSPGTVSIGVQSNPTSPNDFDSLLRLFDASGNELAFNDDNGASDFSRIDQFLTPGVYYAGISGFSNRNYNPTIESSGVAGTTGNYSLQFSLNAADPNGLISGAVPVSLGTSRDPLVFDGIIGTDYGVPVGVADVDLFEIVVPDNGTLFIDIDTPILSGFVDSYLRIFDATGTPLVFSDDDFAIDDTGTTIEFQLPQTGTLPTDPAFDANGNFIGHGSDSFIAGTVTRGDVYYIGVSDFFNQDYDPTNFSNRPPAGTGGEYKLTVTFANNDLNGSIDQAIANRPLPTVGQPGIIGADGNPDTGELLEVGDLDVDFVKINSPVAGILEIDIDAFSDSSLSNPADTVASIFDVNGNLLASDDDTTSLDPLLYYQIAANTDYYVAISGYGNDSFDPFLLGSGSPGDTGEYIFNSQVLPLAQLTTLSNDRLSYAAVQSIATGSTLTSTIGRDAGFVIGATDVDLYRFVPTTTGRVDIRTALNDDFAADTVLRLFDARGRELAFNDDATSRTQGSLIQPSVRAGRTYFIGVSGHSDQARDYNPVTGEGAASGSQGDYALLINPTSQQQFGTEYDDFILGTRNKDAIRGGLGNDTISGRLGKDTIKGNEDRDRIRGKRGNDRLSGGDGKDVIDGGLDNDRILGGDGNDRLYGGDGNDVLNGGNGRDQLLGQAGDDTLLGGADDDFLDGGTGNDTLSGDDGRDTFRLAVGEGLDTILDFATGEDKIALGSGLTFEQLSFSQDGQNTIISARNQSLMIVNGIEVNALSRGSFTNT